jgi:HSP20 family protein
MNAQIVRKPHSNPQPETDAFQTLFDAFFGRPSALRPADGLAAALDVVETPEALVVKASMPGVKPEDVEVTIEGRALTLRGESRHDDEHEEAKVYRREIVRGSFTRTLRLPQGIDASKVSATVKDGLVSVTLPWSEDRKPEVVKVPISPSGN